MRRDLKRTLKQIGRTPSLNPDSPLKKALTKRQGGPRRQQQLRSSYYKGYTR